MEFQEIVDVNRTDDVRSKGDFVSLMLNDRLISALKQNGFHSPSPIQTKAIPIGLLGFDMLVQAKSGTGKTLVFAILALANLNSHVNFTQVLIVTPTREIAAQIHSLFTQLAPRVFRIACFVGGESVADNVNELKRGVHIVIGTTGRLCGLVKNEHLRLNRVRLFVLDEADKLMENIFMDDVNHLFSVTPSEKQVLVFSATYPRDLDAVLSKYMRKPYLVRLDASDVQLIGIKQYVILNQAYNDDEEYVMKSLIKLLNSFVYNQCIVFSNSCTRSEEICESLKKANLSALYLSSSISQEERTAVMKKLKNFQIKILVSTDLAARGIDAENVNAVINIGCPSKPEVYLHRIGRAGRFGGYGASFTILQNNHERKNFSTYVRNEGFRAKILQFSDPYPMDLCSNTRFHETSTDFQAFFDARRKEQVHVNDRRDTPVTFVQKRCSRDDDSFQNEARKKSEMQLIPVDSISTSRMQTDNNVVASPSLNEEYSREDILAIYSSRTSNEWVSFGSESFARHIRLLGIECSSKSEMQLIPVDSISTSRMQNDNNVVASPSLNEEYSREDMLAIHSSRTSSEWISFGSESFVRDIRLLGIERSSKESNLYSSVWTGYSGKARGRNRKFSRSRLGKALIEYAKNHFEAPTNSVNEETEISGRCQTVAPELPQHDTECIKSISPSFESDKEVNPKVPIKSFEQGFKYSRNELLEIGNSMDVEKYRDCVQRNFDVSKEPFELDKELFCLPLPQRIRVLRKREADQRKLMKKTKMNSEIDLQQVVSKSRYPFCSILPASSTDYEKDLLYKMRFPNDGDINKSGGPCVKCRRSPEEYFRVIENLAEKLKSVQKRFVANCDYLMGVKKDVECVTMHRTFNDASMQCSMAKCVRDIATETQNNSECCLDLCNTSTVSYFEPSDAIDLNSNSSLKRFGENAVLDLTVTSTMDYFPPNNGVDSLKETPVEQTRSPSFTDRANAMRIDPDVTKMKDDKKVKEEFRSLKPTKTNILNASIAICEEGGRSIEKVSSSISPELKVGNTSNGRKKKSGSHRRSKNSQMAANVDLPKENYKTGVGIENPKNLHSDYQEIIKFSVDLNNFICAAGRFSNIG